MNIEAIEKLTARVLSASQDVQNSRQKVDEAVKRKADAEKDVATAKQVLAEHEKMLSATREELDDQFEPFNQ